MSLDLDLSLDTLIAWKRKPHAMVEDLFGVKPDLCLRIPVQSGRGFRFHAGHHSDLMPATVPR